MCSSRKNPYPPHGRSSEIPRGRGVLKAKILEAKYCMKLNWNFLGGGGCKTKKPSMGGSMDIFWSYAIHNYTESISSLTFPAIIQ